MQAALQAIHRSMTNLLARAVVTGLNTASKCQMLQVSLLAGETKDNVEHLEPYGFTSAPQNGAEGFALFPDGDRSHGVVLMVSDRRYRIQGLTSGEVAIYTDEGDSIILNRGNTINIATKNFVVTTENYTVNASAKISLNSPLVAAQQDVTAGGDLSDQKSTMQSVRDTFNLHQHNENGDGGGTTNAPNQQM